MKSLKALLFSILTVGIIACSSSTGVEDEYPKRVGTFMIQDAEHADWIGGHTKANFSTVYASDTTVLTQPGQQQLSIRHDPSIRNGITIQIIDSTVTDSTFWAAGTDISVTDESPFRESVARTTENNGDYYEFEIDLGYECGESFEGNHIFMTLYEDTTHAIKKVYDFKTEGFPEVIQTVSGCN